MKKLLLTLALVLGFMTVAQAADVTLQNWGDYTWSKSGDNFSGTVEGYSLVIYKGSSQNDLLAPTNTAINLYAGANMTVTAPAGTTFTKVVVSSANSSTKATSAKAAGWKVETAGSGATFVATFTSDTPQNSINFAGIDKSGTGKSFRIKSIVLSLSDGGGEEETVVATPTFNPAQGAVDAGTQVSIACSTESATIHYTTDGSDVSVDSPVYSEPIVVNEAMTIKAMAVKEGLDNSPVATAAYTIKLPVVEQPVFNPAAGIVEAGTQVAISCATEGATIHYTTDGNSVNVNSPVYTDPIIVNNDMTIKAIAVKDGMTDSHVAIANYVIKQDVPVGPIEGHLATFDFTNPTSIDPKYTVEGATADGKSKKYDLNGIPLVSNGCSIVVAQGDSSTPPRLWYSTSNEWTFRIYSGHTMNISAPEGYKLISVNFGNTSMTANKFEPSNTGTYDTKTKTISFEAADNVTEISYKPSTTTTLKTITVHFVPLDATKPDAPVVNLPDDYSGTADQIALDQYKPINPDDPEHLWFHVNVTWKEGHTLHYRITSRGAMLNGVRLTAPAAPATAAYAAAAEEKPVEYTGTLTEGSSAKFSFGSAGDFECHVENEHGITSDKQALNFTGESTGVEDIVAGEADGKAVYYNMQGVRVANPAAGGLYIRVQGSKAAKVLVK